MAGSISIESLRSALRKTGERGEPEGNARFEAMARRFEGAVGELVSEISAVVRQISEFTLTLEDEVETFTSPAYPGMSLEIRDQRVRITHGDDMLLFDPTGKGQLSALGQVEIQASRPIPFLVEKVLYLIPGRGERKATWGYRSVESMGGPPKPFTQDILLRMLHCVFAAD